MGVYGGWESQFTKPDIPISDSTYGVIHGDAHTGNWMIQPEEGDEYSVTVIDWDNAQKAWFVADPGTVVWTANMDILLHGNENRHERIQQMKDWMLEAYNEYGYPITDEELVMGCNWRREFMYYLIKSGFDSGAIPKDSIWYYVDGLYLKLNDWGFIPTC